MKKPFIYLFLIVGAATLSCAYFNTFYNARRNFREAERRRESALLESRKSDSGYNELYDDAIKGASKVLAFYPESRWVDDSLLILGKAFYRKGEYQKAERKFRELLTNFPKSKLVDEAAYWRGLSLWKTGDLTGAEGVLSDLGRSSESSWHYDALLSLGDIRFEAEDYAGASERYSNVSSGSHRRELRGVALLALGRSYSALGEHGRATGYFRASLKQGFSSVSLEYEAWAGIGKSFEVQGEFSKAIETYESVLRKERMKSYFPQLKLMVAQCYYQLGEIEDTIEVYSEIAEDYKGTPYAAEALYRKGFIYQRELKDISSAEEFYGTASRISGSDFADSAKSRISNISLLRDYQAQLADTTKASEWFKVEMLLAEHLLLNFGEPDSALASYYRVVEGDTSGIYAPKAIYAIGWVRKHIFADSTGAAETYIRLLEDYPNSRYADFAREELGIGLSEEEDLSARTEFLAAENLRISGRLSPEGYIDFLDGFVTKYPKSSYVPKALYAIAWIYENSLEDMEGAAEYYMRLVKEFPGSDYAELGSQKVEHYQPDKSLEESVPATAIPDSTAL